MFTTEWIKTFKKSTLNILYEYTTRKCWATWHFLKLNNLPSFRIEISDKSKLCDVYIFSVEFDILCVWIISCKLI